MCKASNSEIKDESSLMIENAIFYLRLEQRSTDSRYPRDRVVEIPNPERPKRQIPSAKWRKFFVGWDISRKSDLLSMMLENYDDL